MRYLALGRTGLSVSAVGLGCGGPSRLGQSQGLSSESSKRVVRRALELGINFFDTAESYATESVLGAALAEAGSEGRHALVSTKKSVWDWSSKRLCTPAEMRHGIEGSLRRLGRERIDVFHLHALALEHVDYALNEIVPVLREAQARGEIGYLAVSEGFMQDTRHEMLQHVLADSVRDVFDVMMVGFNLLNPSARSNVFPHTRRRGIGTLIMFAVRRALTDPARLRDVLAELAQRRELPPEQPASGDWLGFLGDVRDAGYRFCAHEPGVDVVLTGTGDPKHLEQNVASLLDQPLPEADLQRLRNLFAHLDSISGH